MRTAAAAQGKKLDMGKSCLRFRRLEDLPLEAIGELIASMSVEGCIAQHEVVRAAAKSS